MAAVELSAWRAWVDGHRDTVAAHLRTAQAGGARPADLHRALGEVGNAVDAVAARDADVARALAPALAERACSECRRGPWTARSPLRQVVTTLVPGLGRALGPEPATAVDDLVAATRRLRGAAAPGRWGRALVEAMANEADSRHLRAAVTVAAWRAGAVRWRTAALAAGTTLPEAVLRGALALDQAAVRAHGGPHAVLARHAHEPWWWPGAGAGPWRVGGFRGFGGAWVRLPDLLGGDGFRWLVSTPPAPGDGCLGTDDRIWLVRADVHGWDVREAVSTAWPAWANPSGEGGGVRGSTSPTSYYLTVTTTGAHG